MRIGRIGAPRSGPILGHTPALVTVPVGASPSSVPSPESTTPTKRQVQTVRVGRDFVRLDVRRGPDGLAEIITVASDTTRPLSAESVAHVLATFRNDARPPLFRSPAITAGEAEGYERNGFATASVLRLLAHDISEPPPRATSHHLLRAGRTADLDDCVRVDALAFSSGQQFDRNDVHAALDATDRSRIRVATTRSGDIVGYAVTGRARRRGYLQRLAVDPAYAGQGIGSALVSDSLRWCRRRGVRRVVVNTHSDNLRALTLYRRLGFTDTPLDLLLMERRDA